MSHRFDTGLRVAQRTAIRREIVAALDELRRSPGPGALYLADVVDLPIPVPFTSDEEVQIFRALTGGRSPIAAVTLGDRTFSSQGSDRDEWSGTLEVHVYSTSANARSPLARVAGDVTSEASVNADPGIDTTSEHILERLSGLPLRACRAAELRPVREGVVAYLEDSIVFEQVFSVETTTNVNPIRDLTQRTTEIDTSHTDHDNPLPAGDADPATGPAPRPLTTLPFGAP